MSEKELVRFLNKWVISIKNNPVILGRHVRFNMLTEHCTERYGTYEVSFTADPRPMFEIHEVRPIPILQASVEIDGEGALEVDLVYPEEFNRGDAIRALRVLQALAEITPATNTAKEIETLVQEIIRLEAQYLVSKAPDYIAHYDIGQFGLSLTLGVMEENLSHGWRFALRKRTTGIHSTTNEPLLLAQVRHDTREIVEIKTVSDKHDLVSILKAFEKLVAE